ARRGANLGEEDLGEAGVAVDLHQRAHLHPGGVHVTEDEADALVLGGIGIGPAEYEDPVAEDPQRGPDLLAADDEIITVTDGAGAQRGKVAAGVGFGEPLAP